MLAILELLGREVLVSNVDLDELRSQIQCAINADPGPRGSRHERIADPRYELYLHRHRRAGADRHCRRCLRSLLRRSADDAPRRHNYHNYKGPFRGLCKFIRWRAVFMADSGALRHFVHSGECPLPGGEEARNHLLHKVAYDPWRVWCVP